MFVRFSGNTKRGRPRIKQLRSNNEKTHYSVGSRNRSSVWSGINLRQKGLEKFCQWTLLRNGVDRRQIDSDQQIMKFL